MTTTLAQLYPTAREKSDVDALLRAIEVDRDRIDDALLKSGALLIRGFAVDTTEQFAEIVSLLAGGGGLREYRGGASPRAALLEGTRPVYNSTEYPPHIELRLHNELSYSADHPARVYFLCLTEPKDGGETTVGDSRRLLANMPPAVRTRFEQNGIRYIRNLPPGRGSGYSWQDAFRSDDPAEVERRCVASGAEYEWLDEDFLRVVQDRPAVAVHPETGEEVWFNQADGFHPSGLDEDTYAELLGLCGSEDRFRLNARYGDGSPIDPDTLATVREVVQQETRPHVWRKGDVLVLDNMIMAHGRRPFRGPRRIAAAMS